ncbi:hypothetical protein FSW04_11135 [Baekduia soli]|uniref:B12-binding domain-containing protein n=1 Tax=Baekduia soli TaxID=496014 RepID=A0A5B8U4M6_9ACTN|nr:cobalamin-dependent protein [Baekduia soli]QEC48066.1 hypothetical protein FSW04_11135 [Baekduia soli]
MTTIERPIRFELRLWAELDERSGRSGEDVSRLVNAAVERFLHANRPALRLVRAPDDLATSAAEYAEALLDFDAHRAEEVARHALDGGATVLEIYTDLMAPALRAIGHGWALDEVAITQEHYASEATARLLGVLAPAPRQAPASGRLAVVGGSPGELHVLGARMAGDLLERAGWEVLALGADTPAGELLELVAAECPDLVALSTSTAGRVPGLEEVLRGLAVLDPRPCIAVGGPLYTEQAQEFARELGADLATDDLRDLLELVRRRFPGA